MTTKKLYILAGEASGDLHGANLIRHLRETSQAPLEIYGTGGDKMREAGVLNFFDLAHFHVTGLSAALKTLPKYQQAAKTIFADIEKVRPDLVILIDNPGFNLHMAKKIHGLGIPIVYFIAPQVWAWAPERVKKIKRYITKVLVVFQFEQEFFEKNGVPVAWVGHPMKDLVGSAMAGPEFSRPEKRKGHMVSLLPGSRRGELKALFPIFLKAAKRIRGVLPGTAFAIIKAPTLPREAYEEKMKKVDFPVQIVERYAYHTIHESDLAIVCSGTATLECALLGTPMIIANRGSLLTYVAAKSVIRVPYLGLPNLILGEKKFPELLQYQANPVKLSDCAIDILSDKKLLEDMKKACVDTSSRLGEGGAGKRAAEEILSLMA